MIALLNHREFPGAATFTEVRRCAAEVAMLWMEEGLYLRVEELPGGPRPLPLLSGFSLTTAYRALGCFNPSETSDAYFILSNDRDEVWFICNRHLRAVYLQRDSTAFRLPLASFDGQSLTGAAPALRFGFSD